ncbi:TspO/MBR family protein [Martelella endophytica]|uniref:CrtK/TspO family sensor protein n=1 Tax=Martelella endophytica TaxID=1486262 RepID=A0A0D5LPQ0_MAREN|nr:TspO/MBR family protein [Martelella endophytica]AJY45747.1 CrtK/TspO family sensor protein [Martelella endophytica]
MNKTAISAAFVIGTVIAGLLVGYITLPGEWYAGLAKPPFNPPNWIFGPVWTVLYILIGRVGARAYFRRVEHPNLLNLWIALLILNLLWSPAFFGLHQMVLALAIIILLLLGIIAFIAIARKRDPVSAGLFVPYLIWVAFATLLNASLLYLN